MVTEEDLKKLSKEELDDKIDEWHNDWLLMRKYQSDKVFNHVDLTNKFYKIDTGDNNFKYIYITYQKYMPREEQINLSGIGFDIIHDEYRDSVWFDSSAWQELFYNEFEFNNLKFTEVTKEEFLEVFNREAKVYIEEFPNWVDTVISEK